MYYQTLLSRGYSASSCSLTGGSLFKQISKTFSKYVESKNKNFSIFEQKTFQLLFNPIKDHYITVNLEMSKLLLNSVMMNIN